MINKVVQRSPDIGIGIRMQRLQQPAQQLRPQPPSWFGWVDASGQSTDFLELANNTSIDLMTAWLPGTWVAFVEGATVVRWEVRFTPKLWLKRLAGQAKLDVAWEGEPIALQLPPALPLAGDALFERPARVTAPIINIGGVDRQPLLYWYFRDQELGFPSMEIPYAIAAANTLSVFQHGGGMPGILDATAYVDELSVGAVTLVLTREIRRN